MCFFLLLFEKKITKIEDEVHNFVMKYDWWFKSREW